MTSVLNNPITDSARAFSYESPMLPAEGSMPASANRSVYRIDKYAAVTVMDQAFGVGTRPEGLFQSIQGDVRLQRVCGAPTDDLPREDVDDEPDVDEAAPRCDVSEIRNPKFVRPGRAKIAID